VGEISSFNDNDGTKSCTFYVERSVKMEGGAQEREKKKNGFRVLETKSRGERSMAWVEKVTIEETPENV
jgi:hypothetical protein